MNRLIQRTMLVYCVCILPIVSRGQQTAPVGVVSHVKVVSDKVPDVSSMEAWKNSFIQDGMSDREKALAILRTKVMFAYQDAPPREYLQEAACVHDPIKTFNVYGYGMCCCASSNIEALARYVGLDARGWAINAHSVSEVHWGDAWHPLDSSLINYFPKEDGVTIHHAKWRYNRCLRCVEPWIDGTLRKTTPWCKARRVNLLSKNTQEVPMQANLQARRDHGTSRREFLSRAALAAATATVVPRHVLGDAGQPSANEKLNIAGVGVGGMGNHNLGKCATENIVALCDIDSALAGKTFSQYPRAKTYKDFRVMLDQQKDIDAVIVATPDHTHAVIAVAAIQQGKHVYVQKPLAHSVHEARVLTEAARKHKVATQLGNQGHSGDGARLICEWIWDGAIGPVREVHAWTNRPVWPQGIEVDRPPETPPVPESLDWDLWLGPAPVRPYHPTYHPGLWRAWWDFGTGSLGDLGCHILDAPFWALKLKYPVSVEGCSSTYWHALWQETKAKNETYPRSTIVRFQFPERDGMPAVKLTWWDGGMMPPRPDDLEEGRRMGDSDGGVLFIGDKGKLMCGCYGRSPRLIPETKMQAFTPPPKTLDRISDGEGGHEQDWIRACKGGPPASSNFDFSGPLSEMVLMGNLAVRYPNRKLLWNGEKMEVTNDAEANAYVRRQYRQGWTL